MTAIRDEVLALAAHAMFFGLAVVAGRRGRRRVLGGRGHPAWRARPR